MMWDRQIEFPSHPITLWDVLDILMSCLDRVEAELFAERLGAGYGNMEDVLDAYDYEMDR